MNQHNPLISVIVPIYNTEKYLDECIGSIVNQTYSNLEILLINDGSTDNSLGICKKWARKDSRIKIISHVNVGLVRTRNIGLENATGEYISFIDSDDYVSKKLYESAICPFKNEDIDIVIFNVWRVDNRGNFLKATEKIEENKQLSSKEALKKIVVGDLNNYYCNKIFKRKMIKDTISIPNRAYEDLGTMYKIFDRAKSIYCLPDGLYFYRQNPNGIIGTMSNNTLRDLFLMRKMRYEDLLKIYPDIAALDFENLAISALRFYDRSLWSSVDEDALKQANDFLFVNKIEILKTNKKNFRLWYYRRKVYNFNRLLKHRIGIVVKKLKRTTKSRK